MVAIPQYESKVGVSHTPTSYYRTSNNPDAFGAAIAQANQNLGESSIAFARGMANVHQTIQRTKALELSNYIDKLEKEDLLNPENGYYSKLGSDAMANPNNPKSGASGVLNDIEQKINKKQQELGLNWGYGLQMAQLVKTRKMDTLYRDATAHELKQTQQWGVNTLEEAEGLAINKGITHRDNETDMQTALGNGRATILQKAQVLRWDKDTTRIHLAKFESDFHSNIISAYVKDGSLKSKEYYEKYKDKLLPKEQESLLGAVKTNELNYIARSTSERLFNLYPEDEASAFAEVDKIDNLQERDAIERRLTHKYSRRRSIENTAQDNLLDNMYNNINEKIKSGQLPSEDDIPMGLNGKNQIAARKYINEMAEKGDVDTDNSYYLQLYEISTTDAQQFSKMNLGQYRPYLSNTDYKSFQKRQNDIKNMSVTQLTDNDNAIKNGLKSLGYTYSKGGNLEYNRFMGRTEKQAQAYKNSLNAYIRELELRKGENLSREDINQAEREFSQSYGENKDKYIEGMNKQVGFMRNVVNDMTEAEKIKGSPLTSEEKNKVIADRVSKTVQEDNIELSSSIVPAVNYQPKVGDIWNGHRITSLYGGREAPTRGASTNHKGIDLAYMANEKIEAFASGKVINVGLNHKGYGNYVDIQSGDGTIHRYAHCNSISVNKGEEIYAGKYIARAGSTGISTGSHLHYEQIKNGVAINPLNGDSLKTANNRIAEGTIIRNSTTGQRMIMKGGKWQTI